jgi:hypothetical protein
VVPALHLGILIPPLSQDSVATVIHYSIMSKIYFSLAAISFAIGFCLSGWMEPGYAGSCREAKVINVS